MTRWFRITWDGKQRMEGHWHLIIVRDRYETGRRIFGAACAPTRLKPTAWADRGRRLIAHIETPPTDACPRCLRVYQQWPRLADGMRLLRPWHVRRTVCGTACGGWTQREAADGEPVPCGGWHRNKRLWCEADAKWAITSTGRGSIRPDDTPTTFFRCTNCAGIYRMDPTWFTCERLMGEPPEALVA